MGNFQRNLYCKVQGHINILHLSGSKDIPHLLTINEQNDPSKLICTFAQVGFPFILKKIKRNDTFGFSPVSEEAGKIWHHHQRTLCKKM